MPRKTFVAGEVLAAADVNTYLMDQAVMTFAGSAARGSAIASPSEGMVSYLEDTDSVEVYDSTNWIQVGGNQAGNIVAVSSVAKTDTFSASVASGASTNVTDLSITHSVSSATNKVLLIAQIGNSSGGNNALLASFAFAEDGSLINIGNADGSRTRVGAGFTNGILNGPGDIGAPVFMSYLHTPGAGSKTYTVRAINSTTGTTTLYVNRSASTVDDAARVRSASNFILMEVEA